MALEVARESEDNGRLRLAECELAGHIADNQTNMPRGSDTGCLEYTCMCRLVHTGGKA